MVLRLFNTWAASSKASSSLTLLPAFINLETAARKGGQTIKLANVTENDENQKFYI